MSTLSKLYKYIVLHPTFVLDLVELGKWTIFQAWGGISTFHTLYSSWPAFSSKLFILFREKRGVGRLLPPPPDKSSPTLIQKKGHNKKLILNYLFLSQRLIFLPSGAPENNLSSVQPRLKM